MTAVRERIWTTVCALTELLPGRGVAALLPDGRQVAVFRTEDRTEEVHGLSNVDPFSGVAVLSRGVVGDLGGVLVVASPMHKQHFVLRTGICVEDPAVTIEVFPVRVLAGEVQVGSP